MIALEQSRQHLESPGLKQAVEVLGNTLDSAASKRLTCPEMLEQLLGGTGEYGGHAVLQTLMGIGHHQLGQFLADAGHLAPFGGPTTGLEMPSQPEALIRACPVLDTESSALRVETPSWQPC